MRKFSIVNVGIGVLLALFYGLPLGAAIYAIGSGIHSHFSVTCTNVVIPFEVSEVLDSNRTVGDTHVQPGANGEKQVCKRGTGGLVSEKTIIEPKTEMKFVGTKETPAIIPGYSYTAESNNSYRNERTGAICADGSRSYATGRGACSWHGGVAEWLY